LSIKTESGRRVIVRSNCFSDGDSLLSEIKNGNFAAFEFLFNSYYPRLLKFSRKFVLDEEIARDLLQDSFLSFWEKRDYLNSVSIKALLFTIVRNKCLNHLKYSAVRAKYQLDYLSEVEGAESLYNFDFLGRADGQLLYDEVLSKVNSVIKLLPPRCKEVFLLSRVEGLKNREIAEKLDISQTAVEKHISKAVSIFSNEFDKKQLFLVYLFLLISV